MFRRGDGSPGGRRRRGETAPRTPGNRRESAKFFNRPAFLTGDTEDDPDPDLVAGAIKLQRAYRLRQHLFRHFGHEFVLDAAGESLGGSIQFEAAPRTAKWVTVHDKTNSPRMVSFMRHYWGISMPELLISVAGGADDFLLSPILKKALTEGLRSLCRSGGLPLILL